MVVIEEWRPISRNTLRGFVTARFPSGLIVHEIAIHVGDGGAWASPPAKPLTDRTGQPIRDMTGKQKWQPLVSFATKAVRSAWSGQVIAALDDAYPGALSESRAA